MAECDKLVLVTGSPRSSTTAFHNALIAAGLFRGVPGDDMLDRDPNMDRNLYTDEYYPSMQLAIAWSCASAPSQKAQLKQQLLAHIGLLREAFANRNGLMLKAPHYAFGIPAFAEAYGAGLHLIYVHRSPFAIAPSMLRHPHISRQLPGAIGGSVDFAEYDLLRRHAQSDVLAFATGRWDELSLLERALFVWYLYANAFLRAVAGAQINYSVVHNESFGESQARRIGTSLGISDEEALRIQNTYRALPAPALTASSLGSNGQKLWSLIEPADAELRALSTRRS